jgi:hypothetical protein
MREEVIIYLHFTVYSFGRDPRRQIYVLRVGSGKIYIYTLCECERVKVFSKCMKCIAFQSV